MKKKDEKGRVLLDPTKLGNGAEALEAGLRRRIVGQEFAVRQIVDTYATYLAGMSAPGRPVANFLFLGPTGSGKTRTVEALAESLVGDARAVTKIDCAEYQHGHEIAKLIGSPPGYLGHKETHPLLSQEALNQYHTEKVKLSFVLFDEVEKASETLWNLLLGILDKATLTLGDNRRVDFSRCMIFLTSNLGAAEMEAILHPKLGFHVDIPEDQTPRPQAGKFDAIGNDAARRRFSPELMNRIDRIVVFQPLGCDELRAIFDIELDSIGQRMLIATGAASIDLIVDGEVKDFIIRAGTDSRYGARHLRRALERLLVQPISKLIASRQIQCGECLCVEFDSHSKRLIFSKETIHRAAASA